MDKVVSMIVSLGVPGLILLFAIGATGLAGGAAITVSLAAIGPGGMIGGLFTLGVVAIISNAISEFGFEKIFSSVLKELSKRGETKEELIIKIRKYPISKDLKAKLILEISNVMEGK